VTDATRLRTEIIEWAKRWRSERCSHAPGCDPHLGSHGTDCVITKNEQDGCALVDALAIADTRASAEAEGESE
jgi:hypothetical protein